MVLSAAMPNHIVVLPGITSGKKSILTVSTTNGYWTMRDQKKVWQLKAGSNLNLAVQSCDKFGNYKRKEISQLVCRAEYMEETSDSAAVGAGLDVKVNNNRDGTFKGSITGTKAGKYLWLLEPFLNGERRVSDEAKFGAEQFFIILVNLSGSAEGLPTSAIPDYAPGLTPVSMRDHATPLVA